jgi:hypothetical protein
MVQAERDRNDTGATSQSFLRPIPLNALRELTTLMLAAGVYFGGRVLVQGSSTRSFNNADHLLELERAMGLDVEAAVQQVALDHNLVRVIGNLSYVWLHWPLLLAALIILFLRDPAHYRQFRSALFLSGSIGLLLFATLPMAPPRFMDGFVGTVSDDARRHHIGYPLSWANKYAAFPSFHVGWTLIACVALAASVRKRSIKVLVVIPAALVGAAVVSTGNHYILDSVSGAAIAVAAYVWFGRQRPNHTGLAQGRSSAVGPTSDRDDQSVVAVEPATQDLTPSSGVGLEEELVDS